MALPILVAEQLGMKPEDFSLMYQDTDAAPWDMGSCGSQTTFNSGRAVIEAAVGPARAAARCRRRGARGLPRRPRARRGRGARQGRAGQVGHDRRPGRLGRDVPRQGLGHVPEAPEVDAESCVGRLGLESFLAPQLITHAVHVKVDRGHRRDARAARGRGARLRRDPQPHRRERAGLRRRRDGHRPGADRGHAVRRGRAGSATRTCSTTSS